MGTALIHAIERYDPFGGRPGHEGHSIHWRAQKSPFSHYKKYRTLPSRVSLLKTFFTQLNYTNIMMLHVGFSRLRDSNSLCIFFETIFYFYFFTLAENLFNAFHFVYFLMCMWLGIYIQFEAYACHTELKP